MNTDRISELRKEWEAEEKVAHIHGWDFSHIHDRYEEEDDLPWDYKKIIEEFLLPDMKLLDFDTGGGEFLLSLKHPYKNTAATEGYAPNVELCKEVILPLGIDFRPCDDESNIPYDDSSFDIIINRHGSFDPVETSRLLKPEGLFITQQVGGRNDRDLVEMVLPDVSEPFPELELSIQRKKFEEAGFKGTGGVVYTMIREAKREDLVELLELYLFLHEDSIPERDKHLMETWEQIIGDSNHHLIVCEVDGKIVSSCVCVIIPNMTRNVRPYAFVENVVTHADHRGKGYAGECLAYAKRIAEQENCYKMMLLTGSKKPETLHFYEKAGYNSSDKTAFIQWIGMD